MSELAVRLGKLIAHKDVYLLNRRIVTPDTEPVTPEDRAAGKLPMPVFHDLSSRRFISWLEDHVTLMGDGGKPVSLSVDRAQTILSADQFRACLREVKGINQIPLPVIRANGNLELLPQGYDPESRLFTMNPWPGDANMTLAQAQATINDILKDFPFSTPQDRAVGVLSLLSLFCRHLIVNGVGTTGRRGRLGVVEAG